MIIGVISDSHPETEVAASAIEWLLARGADLLVHAEGIVAIETLRLLRQSGKPYFAVLGNNNEALTEFKNEFDLYDEPFCTEFAGLRLKIMHHPFYLFDEEPAAQNEADGLNLDADLGTGADRAANFRKEFGADLVKNLDFSDEVSRDTNLGSNCGADRGEILISNSKAADRSVNLDANFNAAGVDKILNGGRGADVNFKNIRSASANFKSRQSASINVSLGVNTDVDVNSNANLDLSLNADTASSQNANLNSNANLAANTSPHISSKASSSADRAVNLTASLSANLSTPNSCVNLATLSLGSNLTANSELNASGKSKNRGLSGYGTNKISTIKIYGHTHYFAAAVDKNGTLVLNPGEICGRKKRLSGFPALWRKSKNCAHLVSVRSAKNYKATERKS
nr:metallophosphoesterase family protein [uncultured Campylobacter sp.]